MKKIIAIGIMLVLSGCMIGPRNKSETIGKETQQSLSQFAVPGRTTNIDILKKFKVLPGFPWVTPVRNWPGRGLDRHRRSRWLS